MIESRRSRSRDFVTGIVLGALAGLIAKDLDLTTLVSYWGQRSHIVIVATLVGGVVWLTSLRRLFALIVAVLALVWLVVAYTPVTQWAYRDLPRRDPVSEADAVFVLASGLHADGGFSEPSMSRILRGLELIGQAWAKTLILTEHGGDYPRYEDAIAPLLDSFDLEPEILTVEPVSNTHDEAVVVAELARKHGFEHLLVVTSPSHSRRASAALEAQGVRVTSVPSEEIRYDDSNLAEPIQAADDHIVSFGSIIHEYAGLFYYRLRGWIL